MNFRFEHGDSFELIKTLPNASVDMILTDPPYGMSLNMQRRNAKFKGVKIANDSTLEWVPEFMRQCFRVLKPDSCAMVFCSRHGVGEFSLAAKLAGFEIKNLLVWDKIHFGVGYNWRPQHELILLLTNGKFKTHSNNLSNIIKCPRPHHSKATHVTEKPVALLEGLIKECEYDPTVILDPFAGTGSCGVACLNQNRKFIGFELDLNYWSIGMAKLVERAVLTDTN